MTELPLRTLGLREVQAPVSSDLLVLLVGRLYTCRSKRAVMLFEAPLEVGERRVLTQHWSSYSARPYLWVVKPHASGFALFDVKVRGSSVFQQFGGSDVRYNPEAPVSAQVLESALFTSWMSQRVTIHSGDEIALDVARVV